MVIYSNFFGAALAFVLGAAIAGMNYGLSKTVLKKWPEHYAFTMLIRQILQIGYIILVFLLGEYTPWERLWLLAGAALGVTLPMICFTFMLVKLNESLNGKGGKS